MKSVIVFFTLIFLQSNNNAALKNYNHKNGIGIKGYDPVSYFQNDPEKGKKDINYKYKGITYLFTSKESQEKFVTNPQKYEPQYGGWCAYAMGDDGSKVDIDPETYKIKDGKLYLFYNRFFTNTLNYWNENEEKLKVSADKNWQQLTRK